jgi:cytochrome c oxidase cbb3-type subunit III
MSKMDSNPKTSVSDEPLISGHNYDGIEEFDNPMPGWWVWMFVACILWTPVYILGVHQFGFINSYEDDLSSSQMELAQWRADYEAANPTAVATEESIAPFVNVPQNIEAGATLFSTYCAMCHGAAAEGLIGPNLTDDYWIHGNTNSNLFDVITNGVLEKGMTPWGAVLDVDQRSQVIAFIRSIHGSNPPGAKAPDGELATPND